MIDLRSDTVTRPTKKMKEAMLNAPVGDDVWDDDPTVIALQEKAAKMFGMEAALFCASGTMTNQIAIKVHTQPGDEIICHKYAHIYVYEGGGMMANSHCSVKLLESNNGLITADMIEGNINPNDIHAARTKMVEVENTANKAGGTCYSFKELEAIGRVAKQNKLAYHLDGARLFNAMVRNNESPLEYGRLFDTISICLSKGLGCPVGSLLLGNAAFILEAKRVRKRFGGGWRQAGFLAAAGIYALDHHIDRLSQDHAKAKILALALASTSWVKKVVEPQTNIVIFEVENGPLVLDNFAEQGVAISAMGRDVLRMVTHLDFSEKQLNKVVRIIEGIKL